MKNHSGIEDFKLAIDSYYHDYVAPDIASKKKGQKSPQK